MDQGDQGLEAKAVKVYAYQYYNLDRHDYVTAGCYVTPEQIDALNACGPVDKPWRLIADEHIEVDPASIEDGFYFHASPRPLRST